MTSSDPSPHILIVDDHRDIRDGLVRYLEKNGFRTTAARNATELDKCLHGGRFDLVVLDVMMPGEDGLSIARRLSSAGGPPILMFSALAEETDRIVGLEVSAHDYLPNPSARESCWQGSRPYCDGPAERPAWPAASPADALPFPDGR